MRCCGGGDSVIYVTNRVRDRFFRVPTTTHSRPSVTMKEIFRVTTVPSLLGRETSHTCHEPANTTGTMTQGSFGLVVCTMTEAVNSSLSSFAGSKLTATVPAATSTDV